MVLSNDDKWKNGFSHLEDYYALFGHCDVPIRYISPDGYHLGIWVVNQRQANKCGKLCHERLELLSKINFTFSVYEYNKMWLNGYNHLIDYFNNCGNVNVPKSYISPDGYHLGRWVENQRQAFKDNKLRPERYELLKKVKFSFAFDREAYNDSKWSYGYSHLIDYFNNIGYSYVPNKYISPDGFRLGNWAHRQRENLKKNRLRPKRYELLKKVKFPFDFDREDYNKIKWSYGYSHLFDYCNNNGYGNVPTTYTSPDGFKLGTWVIILRKNYKTLTISQIKDLEALGFFLPWHRKKAK